MKTMTPPNMADKAMLFVPRLQVARIVPLEAVDPEFRTREEERIMNKIGFAPIMGGNKSGYEISTEGQVALVAATAKTILGCRAPAQFGTDLQAFWIGFDGTDSAQAPVFIELGSATFATNAPGTASTSVTVQQQYGQPITAGFTAAKAWTTEPTVITVSGKPYSLTPFGGTYDYDYPQGRTPDTAVSVGWVLRCTVPTGGAGVNARAGMIIERA